LSTLTRISHLCLFYRLLLSFSFFFNAPAPPEIYPLSLHDALPISHRPACRRAEFPCPASLGLLRLPGEPRIAAKAAGRSGQRKSDRKSTRLNSSHDQISYAVFCLKKKKKAKVPEVPAGKAHKVDNA